MSKVKQKKQSQAAIGSLGTSEIKPERM